MKRAFNIASGLTVEFSYDATSPVPLLATWNRCPPQVLRGRALRRYRRARQQFLRDVRRAAGQALVVVDCAELDAVSLAELALAMATPAGTA